MTQKQTFRHHLLFLSFLLFALPATAQDIYWPVEARTAYDLLVSLRLDEARSIIRLQNITHPENRIWPYLEDYADFLQLFLQEDLRNIPEYLEKSDARLTLISEVPETNSWSLMMQAQVNLHHCALRMQQGQFLSAATDINKAFKLLKRNQKLFPDDMANLRLYAALKVVYGAVPDQYRWLVSILSSLTGTIDEGMKELHYILEHSDAEANPYFAETVLFTALIENRFDNQPEEGLQLLRKYIGKGPQNDLQKYVFAILLIQNGNNDAAIRTLTNDTGTPGGVKIPFLEFMLGQCKLFRGDSDADLYFKNFLVLHKGKHFIKEAHQKMAWYALLQGDRSGYYYHMQQILIRGAATTDEDQQALHEAESHETPHPVLLRARLYADGGYDDQALDLLTDALYESLSQHEHRLEFLYRKGRVLQAKAMYPEALHYFSLTIASGQFESYYFACSAALQSGLIHESLGSKGAAAKYYYMCLEMYPETYATGLHQEARTGLNRIGQ